MINPFFWRFSTRNECNRVQSLFSSSKYFQTNLGTKNGRHENIMGLGTQEDSTYYNFVSLTETWHV